MRYKVIVQTGIDDNGAMITDTYKVYSHRLDNNCLILRLGTIPGGAAEEMVIPVNSFKCAWSEGWQ